MVFGLLSEEKKNATKQRQLLSMEKKKKINSTICVRMYLNKQNFRLNKYMLFLIALNMKKMLTQDKDNSF